MLALRGRRALLGALAGAAAVLCALVFLVRPARMGHESLEHTPAPRPAESRAPAAGIVAAPADADESEREPAAATDALGSPEPADSDEALGTRARAVPVVVRVLGARELPLVDAVEVSAHDGLRPARPASRRPDGAFHLALPAGGWTLVARAAGHAEAARALEIEPTDRSVEQIFRLTPTAAVWIALEARGGAALTGTLEARVIATRERPRTPLASSVPAEPWSECGRWRPLRSSADPRRIGLLELDCEPPFFLSLVVGRELLATQVLEAPLEELVFVLEREQADLHLGALRLRYVDLEGQDSSTRATVVASADGLRVHGLRGQDGVVRLGPLPPGPARVELVAEGFEPFAREVLVEAGVERDLGTFELRRAKASLLSVELRGALPLEAARVLCRASGPSGAHVLTRAAEGGRAELPLGPGSWLVWAEARSGGVPLRSPSTRVELSERGLRLVLALEPLAALVLEPADGPRALELRDEQGAVLAHARTGLATTVLEAPPGGHELLVRKPGGSEERVPLTLPAAGLRVRLP